MLLLNVLDFKTLSGSQSKRVLWMFVDSTCASPTPSVHRKSALEEACAPLQPLLDRGRQLSFAAVLMEYLPQKKQEAKGDRWCKAMEGEQRSESLRPLHFKNPPKKQKRS